MNTNTTGVPNDDTGGLVDVVMGEASKRGAPLNRTENITNVCARLSKAWDADTLTKHIRSWPDGIGPGLIVRKLEQLPDDPASLPDPTPGRTHVERLKARTEERLARETAPGVPMPDSIRAVLDSRRITPGGAENHRRMPAP